MAIPPILPTPARPVDDAIIDTPWGAWVHDNLLALPRGLMGYAEKQSDTVATSPVVIATIAPVAMPAGRRLLLTGYVLAVSTVAGDDIRVTLMDSTNAVQYQFAQDSINRAGQNVGIPIVASVVTTGQPMGFALKVQRGNGTGAVTAQGSATTPAFVMAQDVGAA
jgi:hypothetical protein